MRSLPPYAVTLCLSFAAAPAPAAELTVTTAADVVDAGDGHLSLREAIAAAAPGDTVLFDFALDGATVATASTLSVDKDLTIDATPLPAGLRLDAGGAHRLVDIPAGATATLRGLSFLNGVNGAQNGGGVRCFGNATIEGCLFNGCNARFGGGLWGGDAAQIDIADTTFSGNFCTRAGSAFGANGGADLSFRNVTMVENTGLAGPNVLGGGAGCGGYFAQAGTTATFSHCIIADNLGRDGSLFNGFFAFNAQFISDGYNLSDQPSGPANAPTDIGDTEPMLAPLAYWGGRAKCHRPLPGSPVVDAGDPAFAPPLGRDAIGAPRVAGAAVEIGAVERGAGTFEQWCEFYGVAADPAADDDGDGSTQLAEYVFGTDPDIPGPAPRASAVLAPGGLVRASAPLDLARGDTALIVQTAGQLAGWQGEALVTSQSRPPGGVEPVTFELDPTATPRRFARFLPYLGRPAP